MNLGKERRLGCLIKDAYQKTILVPMDHGMTMGPIQGISNIKDTINKLAKTEVDGVILHKGIIMACEKELKNSNLGLIMHLSANTCLNPSVNYKAIIGTVEEAVAFGCDGVSIHVNIGDENESKMLAQAGKVAGDCYKFGMPLLAMMYARGPEIDNEKSLEMVEHAARVGAELGADLVKVNYTGNAAEFKEAVCGCPVPVIIAGGEKLTSEEEFLEEIEEAMTSGISGVSVGRNVFQSEDMPALIRKIHQLVHQANPEVVLY